ncbi:MAG: stage II sporulation protein M [Methanosarcinaceae archaeon]|nr:stage II sporulation protein M [Methanosarcinaceae archaeon]
MQQEDDTLLRIGWQEMNWSVKVFASFAAIAFVGSMVTYLLMTIFSQPQVLNEAIVTTAQTATAKVELGARYTDPLWAVFIFNSIAAFTASAGTGLFLCIHRVLYEEMVLRLRHPVYANVSCRIERLFSPLYRLMRRVALVFKPELSKYQDESPHEYQSECLDVSPKPEKDEEAACPTSIWNVCGYTRNDYRTFASIIPYTVPVLVMMANGSLVGILLAFFTFNGGLSGFQIAGVAGIPTGLFYNLAYFLISLLPHGIIEFPVLFLVTALGYRFARTQSDIVLREGLFLGESVDHIRKDGMRISTITKSYLRSAYLWKILGLAIALLFLAAYIEMRLTPHIVEIVMGYVDLVVAVFLDRYIE